MTTPKRMHRSYKNGESREGNRETGQFLHRTLTELYGDGHGCGFQRAHEPCATAHRTGGQQGNKGESGLPASLEGIPQRDRNSVLGVGNDKGRRGETTGAGTVLGLYFLPVAGNGDAHQGQCQETRLERDPT